MSKYSCMFCGAPADTKEHVIPQWMHRFFNIKHEKLRLRNGTQIQYAHEVVPACQHCNGVRFARIEQRVSTQTASSQELYVWAMKVYRGLNLRDSFLPESRRDPSQGHILTKEESLKGVEFATHILANYGRKEFTTYPNPFGSVFEIDLPEDVESGFALCSIGFPYNVITISNTERKLLTVLLNDKGLTHRAVNEGLLPNHRTVDITTSIFAQNSDATISANTYAKFVTLHYCKLKYRISIPRGQISGPNRVAAIRLPTKIRVKPHDDPSIFSDILKKLFELSLLPLS